MRRIKIVLAGAAAGLVLLAFWSWQGPARAITRSDSPPIAPREPIWRTCLRDIASDPNPTERAADLGGLAEALPGAELRAAIDALETEAEGTPGARLRLLLLRRWADHAPAAAAAWEGRLADDNQTAASLSVGYGLARKDPSGAVTLAERLPPGQAREGLLQYAVQQWALHDQNGAAAWAARLPDRASRDQFFAIVAAEWARQDPSGAAAFATSTLTAGKPRDEALLQIAASWTRTAPEQAADWINRFPSSEGEVRDFAIEHLMATWARKDLVKAGEWLIHLPMGNSRDVASSAYIPILAVAEPDLAAQWLETIHDPAIHAVVQERLRHL